jgi:hypothetical protein
MSVSLLVNFADRPTVNLPLPVGAELTYLLLTYLLTFLHTYSMEQSPS